MLDLANINHKRGIVILSAKEYRQIERHSFHYATDLNCCDMYLECIRELAKKDTITHDDAITILNKVAGIKPWIEDARKEIDKIREVLI